MQDSEDQDHDLAAEQIKFNKLQQQLASNDKPTAYESPKSDLPVAKPHTLTASEKQNIPETLMCIACCAEPRSTVIVSCKHSVYCLKCDNAYNLKHASKRECPICRKEYKKTIPIFFG